MHNGADHLFSPLAVSLHSTTDSVQGFPTSKEGSYDAGLTVGKGKVSGEQPPSPPLSATQHIICGCSMIGLLVQEIFADVCVCVCATMCLCVCERHVCVCESGRERERDMCGCV